MKRLYIALFFIAMIISFCVFEQIKVNSFYDEVSALIDSAEEYANAGDYETAYKKCESLDTYFQKQYKTLSIIINNQSLDEMSVTIHELKALAKNDDAMLKNMLLSAKVQAQQIKNNQRITLENIL
ncbi:MAG: DUF4363 family protein [Eubacterium sp.]|nr:DUF4363 family protein [Eubacterium sp.]